MTMNAPDPIEVSRPQLTEASLAALSSARRWARLVGVAGVLFAAFMALGTGALFILPGVSPARAELVPLGVIIVPLLGCSLLFAVLVLGYSGKLKAFTRGDRPALAAAFRKLRMLWILMTLAYALSLVLSAVMTLNKLRGGAGP
jgi:hypothetical protein